MEDPSRVSLDHPINEIGISTGGKSPDALVCDRSAARGEVTY
jgi:hypothetical protein